ncbi:MAG TPA: hypothetical protein VLM05_03840 [Mycobacteriales bacterium]|nr:hypothetical protein [Mycobacteriales bacterium]
MTDDDLDDLLRRSLAREAEWIEPADGLRAIRARTVRNRGRSRWRVPALALAGAVAVVAALVAAPSLLPRLEPSPAGRPASPAASSTRIPGAGVNDLPTVWPYGSRAAGFRNAPADQAAGTYGDLTRPDQVAVRFVGSYLGSRGLVATPLGPWEAGLRMQVNRDGRTISTLYLVRVRVGDDAPYVVVDAEAPLGLTMQPVRSAAAGGVLTVRGTVLPGSLPPRVQVRTAGADPVLSSAVGTVTGTDWEAGLSRPDGTGAAVTAWVSTPDGAVRAFVSRPLG